MNNEKGFTIAEGLVSLSSILLVSTVLFPLMFLILQNLEESKHDLLASRLLYEKIEEFLVTNQNNELDITIENIQYSVQIRQFSGENKWKACVQYENKKRCITPSI